MTEAPPGGPPGAGGPDGPSAGAMLRAARERNGIHIAVLAATIKVAPAKLEALEADRIEDLPNASFARALAQSVCRSLKTDARPILAALPPPDADLLGKPVGPLNTPFRERPGHGEPGLSIGINAVGMMLVGALLLAAVALVLAPQSWFDELTGRWAGSRGAPKASGARSSTESSALPEVVSRAIGVASEALSVAVPSSAVGPGASSAAAAGPAGSAAGPLGASPPPASLTSAAQVSTASEAASAAAGAKLLRLRARSASWIEVVDAGGQLLMSRTLVADETVEFQGPAPLKVKVGNAAATEVSLRGQIVDLAPYTRDNIARLELR